MRRAGEGLMGARWRTEVLPTTFRVTAIAIGGYGLTSALCALTGLVLVFFGMPLSDAMLATVLLGYLFYVALVMWGFADRRTLIRPWLILLSAAVTMSIASLLAPLALAS
jgi:hypothetical protein